MKSMAEKKMLWGVINKMNGRQMFFKKRLPPKDKELQVYAIDKNLATRTQNCQVQLLIENNGIRKSIDVNSLKTIDDKITIAVQKKKNRLLMDAQRVVGTKQYHTMQLIAESKAVAKEISDQEIEKDSPESKRLNL